MPTERDRGEHRDAGGVWSSGTRSKRGIREKVARSSGCRLGGSESKGRSREQGREPRGAWASCARAAVWPLGAGRTASKQRIACNFTGTTALGRTAMLRVQRECAWRRRDKRRVAIARSASIRRSILAPSGDRSRSAPCGTHRAVDPRFLCLSNRPSHAASRSTPRNPMRAVV